MISRLTTYGHVWSRIVSVATEGSPADVAVIPDCDRLSQPQRRVTRKAAPDVPQVMSAAVGGLVVGKHTLTSQSKLLESLCGRVGRRLSRWLTEHQGALPDQQWVEAYRYYQATLLGLLKEQRERARLLAGELAELPLQSLEAQFRSEMLRAIESFEPADWARVDAIRVERTGPGQWVRETEESK